MDLRSIINTEAGEGSSSKQAAPVVPIQTGPAHQVFREYTHAPQASPGKHLSQDYGNATQPGAPYASPASYQATYPGRPPPPPPIQAPPQQDLRSPAGSLSAQSPYRQTPTSSVSGGYPFPGHQTTPQSPAQHQQYPTIYQRDSYSQSNPPHLQHHPSQTRASPSPQTPPIGMPGQPHPMLQHQRSHSSVSASSPTSAQSQPQYHNQFAHESPIATTPYPPSHVPPNQRQQSQPGTPLGPPITQRQSSGGFAQTTSPYQQRGGSGPFNNYPSPAAPPPAAIPRHPSTPSAPSAYDSQRTSLSDQQRRSQSERERSLSVSPKTRLPSQPPAYIPQPQHPSPYSMKRKMDEREKSVEEPRRIKQEEIKPHVNGAHKPSRPASSSPQQPAKKRVRYTEPPIFAQSVKVKGLLADCKRKANGNQPAAPSQPRTPLVTNGHQPSPGPVQRPVQTDLLEDDPSVILGPWERTIADRKPQDAVSKNVADWMLRHVVQRSDYGELSNRGVQIEIEAKLGQLEDMDTNERYQLPIETEAVVQQRARTRFRSSMTEAQHKQMNEFLNAQVQASHPNNPFNANRAKKRVELKYRHRREIDKFYELPASHLSTLPPAIQEALSQYGSRHPVKVRVSTDQKSGEVLAMIIKARVADMDIYFPGCPMDCRISINLEMPYESSVEDLKAIATDTRIPDRNKDRLSYSQSHYQVDLTQVTQVATSAHGQHQATKEHELEIELNAGVVREQGLRAIKNERHEYLALIEGLVDNVRLLARFVRPP